MLRYALLVLTVAMSMKAGEGGVSVWWVFFTDRGPDIERRLEARTLELIDSPAWGRRLSAGITEADELDLLPWEGYVERLKDLDSFRLHRTSSRFLNAVSVEVNSAGVSEILALPFVARMQPVSSSDFAMPVFDPVPPGAAGLTELQLQQIGLDELHSRGWTGSGVTVGILDTGFDLVHEVFSAIDIVAMYDFVDDDDDPSQQPGDPAGQSVHGTAVLSVMGGYTEGLFTGGTPDASFILAKTEDISDEYPAEEDYWVQGLEWIESLGGELVNSSLAYIDWYDYSDLDGNTAVTTVAADAAASRGMPVFNAIGNAGPDPGTLMAPADGDSVFAVGALDALGSVTAFSSRGPTFDGRIKPEACALGENVALAWEGISGYHLGSGTSFAAPLAASAAAALRQAHREWSMLDIMDALRETATQSASPDNVAGYGVIDALSALNYRSVTGSARYSDSFEYVPEYPLTLIIEGSVHSFETNGKGWFAFCPEVLGDFTVTHGGGPGSVIPVSGTLDDAGTEIEVFVDMEPGKAPPSLYPNPSRGDVYIGFDLTEGPVDVVMTVFDLTGQMVRREIRTAVGPGTFRAPLPGAAFHWDGCCTDGSPAASGIYLVMLRTGDRAEILKCSIVR